MKRQFGAENFFKTPEKHPILSRNLKKEPGEDFLWPVSLSLFFEPHVKHARKPDAESMESVAMPLNAFVMQLSMNVHTVEIGLFSLLYIFAQ